MNARLVRARTKSRSSVRGWRMVIARLVRGYGKWFVGLRSDDGDRSLSVHGEWFVGLWLEEGWSSFISAESVE